MEVARVPWCVNTKIHKRQEFSRSELAAVRVLRRVGFSKDEHIIVIAQRKATFQISRGNLSELQREWSRAPEGMAGATPLASFLEDAEFEGQKLFRVSHKEPTNQAQKMRAKSGVRKICAGFRSQCCLRQLDLSVCGGLRTECGACWRKCCALRVWSAQIWRDAFWSRKSARSGR